MVSFSACCFTELAQLNYLGQLLFFQHTFVHDLKGQSLSGGGKLPKFLSWQPNLKLREIHARRGQSAPDRSYSAVHHITLHEDK